MCNYTGADMWREYCAKYGRDEARKICNDYLDMQGRLFHSEDSKRENADEYMFCCELFAEMGK